MHTCGQFSHSWPDGNSAHGHTAGNGFAHHQHIGHDAHVFTGKPASGAAKAGLHFVDDEQSAGFVTNLAHGLEVVGTARADTAFALHDF